MVIPSRPILALAKTISNATPNVGDIITYTVTLTNNGPDQATNVQVTDLVPAGLTFISATPSKGTYVSATGAWTVGTVSTTVAQTLQIQARVFSSSAETNTASITHSDQYDPNLSNNTASATVTPGAANNSLAGSVYFDTNNNAMRDPGEIGIPGITITLTGTDEDGHSVFATPS